MTVGEFTHLDPESCIAGETGRSECVCVCWRGLGVPEGSNLRHLLY